MTDKPSIPDPKSQKQSPADRLVKESAGELEEKDLKRVTGGLKGPIVKGN